MFQNFNRIEINIISIVIIDNLIKSIRYILKDILNISISVSQLINPYFLQNSLPRTF